MAKKKTPKEAAQIFQNIIKASVTVPIKTKPKKKNSK